MECNLFGLVVLGGGVLGGVLQDDPIATTERYFVKPSFPRVS